jgi:ribosomal protein S12
LLTFIAAAPVADVLLGLDTQVDENDEVLISGFGRRGKAKGDIPGVRYVSPSLSLCVCG